MNLKTSFFSKRNLLVIVLCVFVGYLLVWGGALIENKIDRNRISRADKLNQERYNNLSKEEKAILKAQGFLMDSITTVAPPERILLSYIQRKFNLPNRLGVDEVPINLNEDLPTYPDDVHYLARIASPNKIVKVPPKNYLEDNLKVINIYSANCDHMPLPANFWLVIEQNIQEGGYPMTHVALAFAMMRDNGCKFPADVDKINDRVMQGLVKLADDPATIADLRYEAIAFLLLSERRDLVKQFWIDQIVKEQRDDGGWSKEVGDKKIDYHSVILAFWALLEYERPNTPDVQLIRESVNEESLGV